VEYLVKVRVQLQSILANEAEAAKFSVNEIQ
jgi:hypothetical protein